MNQLSKFHRICVNLAILKKSWYVNGGLVFVLPEMYPNCTRSAICLPRGYPKQTNSGVIAEQV